MPRLPADAVKQGLLHPDVDVRSAALRYFADAHDPDPAVMPAAIDALDRYGRTRAFRFLSPISALAQTEASVRWAVAEVTARPAPTGDDQDYLSDYGGVLARLLCQADPRLVRPHEDALSASPAFGPEHRTRLARRIRHLSLDGDTLWRDLEAVCEAGKDDQYVGDVRWAEGQDLVEAMARQGGRHAARAMDLLALRVEDFAGNPMAWLEPLAVRLAGGLRHGPAVPLILGKLHEDGDVLSEECQTALVRIGTDAVVRAVRDAYPAAEWHFRLYATGVLGGVRSDLAVQSCVELLAGETDLDLQNELAKSLVEQFSTEGNEAAYRVLRDDPDLRELRDMVAAACVLTGQDFPELEGWRRAARDEKQRKPFLFGGPAAPPAVDRAPAALKVPPPVRRDEGRAGRNDPCPCGSGKKFKKCCLR